ncbi:MAG TPA: macrolide ABC transporter ATP-binding protein [Gallionella sp.]|jgi:putative ABC transport system ATP-binding protein|nr:ABC transporter ATP-binding protein [Gallionella sp.]OGS67247.1 MAG: macrolide ABC transporter ATP-binding protein [Gallionellales bacterium GWA2_54_124]OGT19701.1 MAG: macrolide ABC transporter ATP-binding protein [Gallionellales bacterium RIFOXYD12_FULL_53_10]HCI52047.1 macrolide ABC transporter ATP-binding protein [Gallionella sp.]
MIQLSDVSRSFVVGGQTVSALRNIDLSIADGDYVSIMGPSGSGKSTLLNLIGLLDRPSSGIYKLDGGNVTALNDEQQARVRSEKIGFVFQSFHLVPRLSAAMNIELPLILAGIPVDERRRRVAQLLDNYGLTERADHRPDQLSGGQRQRVAIARATSMHPSVLLADEPTGNLDQATGREVINLLEQLTEQQVTLILVTHDPVIGGRAKRQLHMVDGQIISQIES